MSATRTIDCGPYNDDCRPYSRLKTLQQTAGHIIDYRSYNRPYNQPSGLGTWFQSSPFLAKMDFNTELRIAIRTDRLNDIMNIRTPDTVVIYYHRN